MAARVKRWGLVALVEEEVLEFFGDDALDGSDEGVVLREKPDARRVLLDVTHRIDDRLPVVEVTIPSADDPRAGDAAVAFRVTTERMESGARQLARAGAF